MQTLEKMAILDLLKAGAAGDVEKVKKIASDLGRETKDFDLKNKIRDTLQLMSRADEPELTVDVPEVETEIFTMEDFKFMVECGMVEEYESYHYYKDGKMSHERVDLEEIDERYKQVIHIKN